MHHPTDRITHTAFVTPDVEHWLEREIAQWVHSMKDRSDDPSRTLLPQSYISLLSTYNTHILWIAAVFHCLKLDFLYSNTQPWNGKKCRLIHTVLMILCHQQQLFGYAHTKWFCVGKQKLLSLSQILCEYIRRKWRNTGLQVYIFYILKILTPAFNLSQALYDWSTIGLHIKFKDVFPGYV